MIFWLTEYLKQEFIIIIYPLFKLWIPETRTTDHFMRRNGNPWPGTQKIMHIVSQIQPHCKAPTTENTTKSKFYNRPPNIYCDPPPSQVPGEIVYNVHYFMFFKMHFLGQQDPNVAGLSRTRDFVVIQRAAAMNTRVWTLKLHVLRGWLAGCLGHHHHHRELITFAEHSSFLRTTEKLVSIPAIWRFDFNLK